MKQTALIVAAVTILVNLALAYSGITAIVTCEVGSVASTTAAVVRSMW